MIMEDGQVMDPPMEEFLRDYMSEFEMFIKRVLTVLPRQT